MTGSLFIANDTAPSRTRAFVIALLTAPGFLLLVHLLPSLAKASDQQIVIKALVEICASVALLYALIRWGGVSPEALGVGGVRASSFGWGLICFIATAVLSAIVVYSFAHFGIGQDKGTLAALASHSIPIILLIAAMAGIAEEIVFRSILISQLETATGRSWLAAAISLAIFAGAHAGGWGPWQILFAAVPGLILTIFFLWKRDLWVCILAHFLTDALGLLGAAAGLAHHP
jgi:membrane protease YdiL (CAAX protease family)